MKSYSAFEERLIGYSSESTLKNAKQLLKNNLIKGAFRDAHGVLHAVFEDKNSVQSHVHLQLDPDVKSQCDCPDASCNKDELCMHAIALWMYAGLYRVPEQINESVDTENASYVGLKNAGLEALAKECTSAAAAEVVITAESAFPHVPSKWENAVLAVRLRAGKREYLGNLNNLRQLFFDKTLAVHLKFSDFSLLDRQIIRFLAINGEAENSNILLNSELTCEFFHTLGGFTHFYRNGRRIILHNDAVAEAVVLASNGADAREYSPGICYRGGYLGIHSAKVITGKSGCWVGKNGEYFFLPASVEVGFLRNFFRLGKWNSSMPGCAEFLEKMPFRMVKMNHSELSARPLAIVLNGKAAGDRLHLELNFVYDNTAYPPDSGRLALDKKGNFFLRQELIENAVVNSLKMVKAVPDPESGGFVLNDAGMIGLFLDEVLPDWLKQYKNMALGGSLARLAAGGNHLDKVQLECSSTGMLDEQGNYPVFYQWVTPRGGRCTWSEIQNAASRHCSYVKLDDGSLARLEAFDDIVKLNTLVKNLDEERSYMAIPHISLIYFRHLVRHWRGALPAVLQDLPVNDRGIMPQVSGRNYEFKARLRSYQQEGVQYMRKMLRNDFNVILADEMGLGKTVQTLAVFNDLRQYSGSPSLVICPASLVENWSRECEKFLSDCKVGLLYGSTRKEVLDALNDYDLVITSYTMARRESAKLGKCVFNLLVLDEAQHIKNPGTANAHSCKSLKARHKLVLTGTPLENSPEDLWSIFDFLHPGLLGSFSSFKKEYANIGESEELRRDLAARTAPFIKRRVKSDVAPELPPREELTWFCSMDENQRKLYDKVLAEGRESLKKLEKSSGKKSGSNMQILTTLLRLRQICCHPELIEGNTEKSSAKFELLQELLLENIDSGHKVLLFSQFTSLLSIVREYLESVNIPFCYLDGTTRNRQEEVDKFNNSPDIPLFLLSLKAGGIGLNLTSADTVIIYDPWWNPAAELQAADRTHRIGQTRAVRAIKLLVKDSIEEKILALQERKREIFDQVVDTPALAAEKFSIEDLKYLLS